MLHDELPDKKMYKMGESGIMGTVRFTYFVPQEYDQFVKKSLGAFRMGEPASYLFFPKTDRERRIDQLIQDYAPEFKLNKIHLTTQIVDEIDDAGSYVEDQLPKAKDEIMGVFVIRSEVAVLEHNANFIDNLIEFSIINPTYRFLFVSEVDFTHPEVSKEFRSQTKIFNNVNYYPLYEYKDSRGFLDHLCEEWKMDCEIKKKEKIAERCGGHFWLLKEALRKAVTEATSLEDIFNSETMRFRVEQIYFSLLDSDRLILKKVIKGEKINEDSGEVHSVNYLKRMKLISQNKITIPLLEEYVRSHLPKVDIILADKHIMINNVIVDSHFARKEIRALRSLVQKPNQIISRDDVAKAVWPVDTENYYSEWAIDRIMARLRDKVGKLGLDKSMIKTVRGKGYMISV